MLLVLQTELWKEDMMYQFTKIISRYQKSLLNCCLIAKLVDRVYVYDNSANDVDAKLLFRLTDGHMVKQYVDVIPEWAQLIQESI